MATGVLLGGFGMGTGDGRYSPVAFNYLIIGADRSFVFVVRSFTVANWDALDEGGGRLLAKGILFVQVQSVGGSHEDKERKEKTEKRRD